LQVEKAEIENLFSPICLGQIDVETSSKNGYDTIVQILIGRMKERRYAQRESKEGIRRCFKICPG
jgi:hypothetical protein